MQSINGLRSIHGLDIPAASVRHRQDKLASTVIYRTQDLGAPGRQQSICSTIGSAMPRQSVFRLMRRVAGCSPEESLFMAVAADCSYIEHYLTVERALAAIISDWNEVSRVYETSFGLKLGLFHVFVPHAECQQGKFDDMEWNRPCETKCTLTERLDHFAGWVSKSRYPNALWHLRTKCPIADKIGYAYKPKDCSSLSKTAIKGQQASPAVAISSVTSESWKVIAHEIGHNFGANHDCDGGTCNAGNTTCCECSGCDCKGRFLMTATATTEAAEFSQCSKSQICQGIATLASCFSDTQAYQLVERSICGNGIKEEGEACDCGGIDGCQGNQCCDALTCTLKDNAKCDDSNDRCCQSCQVKPPGEVCRPSLGSCDWAETCDGVSGSCPVDRFLPDGISCGNELYCASGLCTSRDLQCQQYKYKTSANNESKTCGISSDRCKLACTNEHSQCVIYPDMFIDGTRCGHNLFCSGGVCQGTHFDQVVDQVIYTHYIIPVCAAVILAILLILILAVRRVRRDAPAKDLTSFPEPPPIHPTSTEIPYLPQRRPHPRSALPTFLSQPHPSLPNLPTQLQSSPAAISPQLSLPDLSRTAAPIDLVAEEPASL
ncbi:hypothetical protein DSO57_1005456 [Entomophthora muscae]|uniref:Uncharacterized protein n=1 Tax=Entomophthora muscae TaxID=34485 RepID=A0ACC2T7T1_9FUNG|nr:hypothetical protein DSO57_1005456 [Entomophthora muscae]